MPGMASRVARGLRSITLSLQGMDDEGNEVLELLPKMESDFQKIGITLYGTDGQLKSTFDILKDLSEKFPELDKNTQNYYASLIGGKTQVDVVNAVLLNFKSAIDATAKSEKDAFGSALKELGKAQEGLTFKLNNLKAQFHELVLGEGGLSSFVKLLIDAGTAVLKFANSDIGKLLIKIVLLNTTIGLVSKGFGKVIGNIPKATGLMKFFGDSIEAVGVGSFTAREGLWLMGDEAKNVVMALSPLAKGGLILGGLATISFLAYEIYKHFFSIEGQINRANKKAYESQQRLDTLKDKTKEYSDEYDKLIEKGDNLAQSEKNRLEFLEQQLEVLKKQTEAESKTKAHQTLESFGYETTKTKQVRGDKGQKVNVPVKEILNGKKAVDALYDSYQNLSKQLKNTDITTLEFVSSLESEVNNLGNVFNANMQIVESGGKLTKAQQDVNMKFAEMALEVRNAGGEIQGLDSNMLLYMASAEMAKNQTLNLSSGMTEAISKMYGLKAGSAEAEKGLALLKLKAISLADGGLWRTVQNNGVGAVLAIAQSAGIASKALADALYTLQTGGIRGVTGGVGATPAQIRAMAERQIRETIEAGLQGLGNISVGTSNIVDYSGGGGGSYTPPSSSSSSSASKGSSESEKMAKYKKELSRYEKELQKSYDKEEISAQKYYNDLSAMYKKYYNQGKISYDEYIDYMEQARESFLKNQKNTLNELSKSISAQMKALDKYADEQKKTIDKQIDALNKEKEALQERNNEQEKSIELEKLQQALTEAKNKKIRVYKEGEGFVYMQDTSAISEAQKNINEFNRKEKEQAELDAIDKQIEALEQQKNNWDKYVKDYSDMQDKLELEMELGMSYEKYVLNNRLDNIANFTKKYGDLVLAQIELKKQMNELDKGNIVGASSTVNKVLSSKQLSRYRGYASGSNSIPFSQFARINERGSELFISPNANFGYMPKGTGIVPHNLTQNLMEIGKYNLAGLKNIVKSGGDKNGNNINQYFDKLVLPNVTDGKSFIDYLKNNFINDSLQFSMSN